MEFRRSVPPGPRARCSVRLMGGGRRGVCTLRAACGQFRSCRTVRHLTPAQRRFAVENDSETPAERHILRPASHVLLNWRRACLLKATQWSLISVATGLLAGTFLLANGTSPLFRLWAGVFLLASEILAVAGWSESAGMRSVRSSHAEIVRALPPILIGDPFYPRRDADGGFAGRIAVDLAAGTRSGHQHGGAMRRFRARERIRI